MLRNLNRTLLIAGAACIAAASALSAQVTTGLRGDVDGDGRVTTADARLVADYLVGRAVPAGLDVAQRGDVNGDGRVTSVDVAIINGFAAGRDLSRFKVGAPVTDLPANAIAAVRCVGSVATRSLQCAAPGDPASGARGYVVVGNQGVYVKLTSSNIVVDTANVGTPSLADDTIDFKFDVTVQNLLVQRMGTSDGTTVDADSVRVFFHTGPNTTSGTGEVEVVANSMNTFTGTNQPYYNYPVTAPLDSGEVTAPLQWHLQMPRTVGTFDFTVYVAAGMQYPKGWIDIYPPEHSKSPYFVGVDTVSADPAAANHTLQLTDSIRNPVGMVVPGMTATWSNAHSTISTVDAGSGLVTGVADGVDTVTASSTVPAGNGGGVRTGRVVIVVSTADSTTSTITASPNPVSAGDSATVTVQLKNASGGNITKSGGTVTLAASNGATVTAVTDNGDGTYTAKVTSTTAGTVTLSGTLNGHALTTTGSVVFSAAAPATITKVAGDEQTGTPGAAVAVAPQVKVTDAYGNPVAGATVTFAPGGATSGTVTGATPTTSAAGLASVGSWTLGTGPNTLTASVSPGTATPVTFTAYVPPTAGNDSSQVMGNTPLPASYTTSVLTNDASTNGGTISLVTTDPITTARNGTLTLNADGTFGYTPAAGVTGRDSAQYTITDGKAQANGWIKLVFVGKVWYVAGGAAPGGDGRSGTPFQSISAAEVVAGANDSILVRTGTAAGGTLKAGQLVYGAGSSAPFNTTLNGQALTLLATGTAPSLGALTLASGNTLRGFTTTGGISGSAFGTLTVSEVAINNASGQALSLSGGTLAGSFTSVQSAGGTNNVSLTNVATNGTISLGTAGDALSGATGDGVVVSGGNGSFTFSGNVSNTSSFAVNVNGKTGGTVNFAGNINPGAAGRGISVTGNNSGGNIIVFAGSKNISSGTAPGVVLSNNTGATIQLITGSLAIATTTGTPFSATGGGTVDVTGSPNTITVTGAAARAVDLSGITIGTSGIAFSSINAGGSATSSPFRATNVASSGAGAFAAGSLTVTGTTGGTSRGLEITSSSAPFTFTTASINGTGGEGIYLTGNTGAIAVNGGTVGNTASTTGDALYVSAGSADVTIASSLTKSTAGRIANLTGRTGGTTTVSGTLSCTSNCTGISATSNTGGTVDFSGATKTLNTGANGAVTLTNNTGATVRFSNGGLALTTSTGTGFNATGGGTVEVTGAVNTVASTAGGVGVNIQNTTIGAGNVTFRSVNKNTGSNYGIRLESTGTSGGFKVTGDGSTANSGGTLVQSATTAADSAAVTVSSTANLSLEFMKVSITTGSGASGITGTNLSGTSQVRNSTIDFNSVAPDAVPAHGSYGVRIVENGANGTITLDGTTIQNKTDGTTAGSLSTGGTSVVNFNIIDSNTGDGFGSTFQNLYGSGWVIGAGDFTGSTSVVNLTVRDSKFLNAPTNGTNNFEMGVGANATLNYKIKDNQFTNVANASFTAGIINVNASGAGVFGGSTAMDSIVGNTITNSGTASTVANLGYIGMRLAFDNSSATTHRVVVANNTITDLWRQGLLLSTRQQATGNIKVVNNIIGTAALPVGQSNRRGIETDLQDNSVMNLEMTGNSVTGAGTSDANASVGLRVGTNTGNATLNATVLSNTIRSTNVGTSGRFRAESAATGMGTMCLDLRTNNLEDNTRLFTLQQTSGTFRVEGAGTGAVSAANVQSANSGGTGNVTGTVTYNNNVNCQQPGL